MQPGYVVEQFASGFKLPVNIAFVQNPTPNGPYFYVTELDGKIKVVKQNHTVSDYATGAVNYANTQIFPGSGEQGLTGIVVEPVTGDVFASMLYQAANGEHYPKVVRFHSTDGGFTAATQTTILDMAGELQGPSHQISNLSIGTDGKLYVHMGDGFITETALNIDSFRGKVLRLNLDGTPPTDNPFYTANGINTARDYVFAYGFRNPFGGTWRAADGKHYEVENGPNVDRLAKVVAGISYGWNGSNESMMINAIYNWSPSVAPVNLAFVQSQTFGGSGFPNTKWDHAFVTESGATAALGPGKRINEFVLDANGFLITGPISFVEYVGCGRESAVGLTAGPDGLYFSTLYADDPSLQPGQPGARILVIKRVP
jgi:glucose/arabinose dehydrogenase